MITLPVPMGTVCDYIYILWHLSLRRFTQRLLDHLVLYLQFLTGYENRTLLCQSRRYFLQVQSTLESIIYIKSRMFQDSDEPHGIFLRLFGIGSRFYFEKELLVLRSRSISRSLSHSRSCSRSSQNVPFQGLDLVLISMG